MKVKDLITELQKHIEENQEFADYQLYWVNLNIDEYVEIEEIFYDEYTGQIVLR